MKKLISIALLLAMCLSLFAGCGEAEPETTTAATDLASAKEYLVSMYQTAGKGEAIEITADKDVLKSVVVAAVTYTVDWSVEITSGDADSVTVGESNQANHVKLDIPLHSGKDILFTATATITDPNGATDTVSFDFKVAGVQLAGEGMTMEELVEAAYALEKDQAMEGLGVLTGKVTMINTPYDEGYKNVTVTIQVGDLSDKVIKCYRLKGEGAENVGVGDIITVSGTLKNYNGNIQFDAGCMLDELTKSTDPVPEAPEDPKQIVADAYALEDNAALPYGATLIGVITSIDTPFDAGFGNITVSMTVEGCEDQPIKCYRLKGDGADTLAVGDTITVTGNLMNYNGTVEFGQGCTLDALVKGDGVITDPTDPTDVPATPETDPAKIMEAAGQLSNDTELPYDVTLSGKVTAIEDAYSAEYQNITVSIAVTGTRSFLKCYRIKGTGVDQIAVGDTITVTGRVKNYNGTIELVNGTMTQRTAGGGTPVKEETDPLKIVDAAYALEENQQLAYDATLTGKVTSVDDAYSADYKNITVTIQVTGRESKPIKCYRMKGDGVEQIAVGDTVTVKGRLKNYSGVVEFDTGCQLVSRVSGGGTVIQQETDPAKIMAAAAKLAENDEMSYDVTLTGKVTAVNDAYNEEFGNITVTIAVNGTRSFLKVYRLKGDGVNQVAVNDTLTVVGRIKNYYGEIEMVNCNLTNRVSGGGTVVQVEKDEAKIVDALYALGENEELSYDATLTGKIVTLKSPYDSTFKNITVVIAVAGREDKPVECYRMTGDNVSNDLCVGDTITVSGRLKNYNGTKEFNSGCKMEKWTSGGTTKPSDSKAIVDAAFALEQNQSLPYFSTLTGKITDIGTPYSDQYKNITVTIEVAGSNGMKAIECYRMKGTGAENLQIGDTITVTGVLKRYYKDATDEKPVLDKIEFDAGCILG